MPGVQMYLCVSANMQVSWLGHLFIYFCNLQYDIIKHRTIKSQIELCMQMCWEPSPGCHPSCLMFSKCIHNHTYTGTQSRTCQMGKKIRQGLLSHLQLQYDTMAVLYVGACIVFLHVVLMFCVG